jgi:hypothetical protein
VGAQALGQARASTDCPTPAGLNLHHEVSIIADNSAAGAASTPA